MQLQIVNKTLPDPIIFAKVEAFEDISMPDPDRPGRRKKVRTCVASDDLILNPDPEIVLQRLKRKFNKINPVLLRATVIKEWPKK